MELRQMLDRMRQVRQRVAAPTNVGLLAGRLENRTCPEFSSSADDNLDTQKIKAKGKQIELEIARDDELNNRDVRVLIEKIEEENAPLENEIVEIEDDANQEDGQVDSEESDYENNPQIIDQDNEENHLNPNRVNPNSQSQQVPSEPVKKYLVLISIDRSEFPRSAKLRQCNRILLIIEDCRFFVNYSHETKQQFALYARYSRRFDRYIGIPQLRCRIEIPNLHTSNIRKVEASKHILKNDSWLKALTPEKVPSSFPRLEPLIPGLDELSASNLECSQENLNQEQRQAVLEIMKAKNRPYPYILFGPPGTGKTAVITEAVIQIYKRSKSTRVLVVGNANLCADSLTNKLINSEQFEPGDLVRLVSGRKGTKDGPLYINTPIDLANLVMQPRVVVATCNMASVLRRDYHYLYEFDFVVIDEAGHAQEPDALIPITLLKDDGSIVLGGDPHQLSPVIHDQNLKDLEESILDRLFKCPIYFKRHLDPRTFKLTFDPDFITQLKVSHRSDERILRVSNQRFYDGELSSTYRSSRSLLRVLKVNDALIFDNTAGVQETIGLSFRNHDQAMRCVNYVRKFVDSGLEVEDIGIICGYKPQIILIKELFKKEKLKPCRVCTIDDFQGEERRVIIVCTVRSYQSKGRASYIGLGFLRDYKRFNVAITRARDLNIVIGDPNLLKDSWDWKAYMETAEVAPARIF